MDCTMHDRYVREPAEYVIWAASGLLAIVVGLGMAFFLWVSLRHSAHAEIATASVVSLSLGTVLIGLAMERPLVRTCLVILAAMLLLSFAFGGPTFARLFN
jgi:hypothetical protein